VRVLLFTSFVCYNDGCIHMYMYGSLDGENRDIRMALASAGSVYQEQVGDPTRLRLKIKNTRVLKVPCSY